jgi:flagellar biosynthetic protein FlhB
MAEDQGEKTLPATPERRQRLRAAGHVAQSADLSSAGVLLGGLLALAVTGGALVEFLVGLLTAHLSGEAWLSSLAASGSGDVLLNGWTPLAQSLGKAVLPVLAVVLFAGVGLNLLQTGFLFLPSKALPDASRINPGAGLARIVSNGGAARLAFGLVKPLVIGGVAIWSLHQRRFEIVGAAGLDLMSVAALTWQLCLETTFKIGLALCVLAVVDYGVRRWRYERDLMMTPQELREELRNAQGDPSLAARRRSLQAQSLPQPLEVAVPNASLIVAGTHHAVALRYEARSMSEPRIIARGAGAVASRLQALAAAAGIPQAVEPRLAEALYRGTPLRGALPEALWSDVARVMAESRATARS